MDEDYEYEEDIDKEVDKIINKSTKKTKKDRSQAAKNAWLKRRERYGKNGISGEGLEKIKKVMNEKGDEDG